MTLPEAGRKGLAFIHDVLGREARLLDSTPTDDGWLVRVIVIERRDQPGSPGGKVWHTLHEVFLNRDMEPTYHLRRGLWTKGLPPARGRDGAEASARGTDETSGGPIDENPRIAEESSAMAEVSSGSPDESPGTLELIPESTAEDPDMVAEEVPPEVEETGAETAGPIAETGAPGERASTPATDTSQDRLEEAEPPAEEEDIAGDGSASEPGALGRPPVQELQGPPRLSFRYTREETGDPGTDRPRPETEDLQAES